MKKQSKILLVCGLIVFVFGLGARLFLGEWIMSIYGLLVFGLAMVGMSVVADLPFYREILTLKTTKNGLSLGAIVLLVAVFLVAINYISQVRSVKWDLTSDELNSLSDQTSTILKNISEEIEFRGFFTPGQEQEDVRKAIFEALVRLYQAESPKVKLFSYDALRRRDLAEKYKIVTSGEVVISIGTKQTTVSDISEQSFTNAIVKLTRNTKNVYSLTGHGERDIEASGRGGIGQFKEYLQDEGYRVLPLNLASGKIPADAAVLMIIRPTQNILDSEMHLLRDFLARGGKMFLALDPKQNTNAPKLSSDMGVEFHNQYIHDSYGKVLMNNSTFALGLEYSGEHEVTSKIKKVQTIFPLASGIRRSPGAFTGITTSDLVMTDATAFMSPSSEPNERQPARERFTIVMATKGKLNDKATAEFAGVVVGDSDFLANETIDIAGANRDLALNILASLSNDAEMISIRPKQAQGTPILLSSVQNGVIVAVLGLVPISLYLLAFGVWWRRRGA